MERCKYWQRRYGGSLNVTLYELWLHIPYISVKQSFQKVEKRDIAIESGEAEHVMNIISILRVTEEVAPAKGLLANGAVKKV